MSDEARLQKLEEQVEELRQRWDHIDDHAVVLPRERWDHVIHVLEDHLDQLEGPVGSLPPDHVREQIDDLEETLDLIMEQVVDGEAVGEDDDAI